MELTQQVLETPVSPTPKEAAKKLFFNTSKTQKEIADAVGVSDRTIRLWIKENAWAKLKQRAHEMPAIIADNLCTQLINLQNKILSRDDAFPTAEEAAITNKLILGMMRLKNYPSSSSLMQFMQHFIDYTNDGHNEFTFELTRKADDLFRAKETVNFNSLDLEYDTKPSYLQTETDQSIIEQPNDLDIQSNSDPRNSTPLHLGRGDGGEVQKNISPKPEIKNNTTAQNCNNQPLTTELPTQPQFPTPEKSGSEADIPILRDGNSQADNVAQIAKLNDSVNQVNSELRNSTPPHLGRGDEGEVTPTPRKDKLIRRGAPRP